MGNPHTGRCFVYPIPPVLPGFPDFLDVTSCLLHYKPLQNCYLLAHISLYHVGIFFPSRLAHMEPDDLDGLIHMSGASAELAELAESVWKARVSLLMVSYLPGA